MIGHVVGALTIGALFGCGVYLLMSRHLVRVLLGVLLMGQGVNLLLLASGKGGIAPIAGSGPDGDFADPLPQALILTSIVITLAVACFLLAMVYRAHHPADRDEDPGSVVDPDMGADGHAHDDAEAAG